MSNSSRPGWRSALSRVGFLKRSAFAGGIRIAGLIAVFALQVILARLIGDSAQYGEFAWGQSLLFLAGSLACLGLPIVTSRFVASLGARGNENAMRAVIRRAQALLLRSSAAVWVVAALLYLSWRDAPEAFFYHDIAVLALVLAPAVCLANLYRDLCLARHWPGLGLLPFQLLRPLATVLFALLCWWWYAGNLPGILVLACTGLSIVAVCLPQAALFHRRQRPAGSVQSGDSPDPLYHPRILFRTALPVFATRCAGLTITYSNVLLVGYLAGPAAAGAYFAAERLAQLAAIPGTVVSSVNQPLMAAAHARGSADDLRSLSVQSAHGALWPTLAIALLLALLSEPLLLVFGDDFASAGTAMIVLVLSCVVAVAMGPAQDVLVMTGRQRRIPRVMWIAAGIHLAILWTLVPLLGAMGAALASLASSAVANVWLHRLVKRHAGIDTTVLSSLGGPR